MRPDVVVEEAELGERLIERVEGVHQELIEFFFQCSEEAFDAAVLPGAAEIDALMADAEQE